MNYNTFYNERVTDTPLTAPMEIAFDYTRSLGPVLGQFMTALRQRRVLGARSADGTVHSPPFEYDPVTYLPPRELVAVGPAGTVLTWSWLAEPLPGQPLDRPFGWALIRLDGADTAMLHAVDAGSADAMRTGMRVRPRWAADRVGSIRDIACFEPGDEAPEVPPAASDAAQPSAEVPEIQSIVVTARRTSERLQDVPVAAAHFPGLRFGRLLYGEQRRKFEFYG